MKKSASSKKDDRVRDNWKERYFAIKGHNLNYYKKQEDRSPKGIIDLQGAKIDQADWKVGLPHTICVQQAKQIYTYLICASQADQVDWLKALRAAAGYDQFAGVAENRTPVDRSQALSSWGVLLMDEGADQPERVVLYASMDHRLNIVIGDGITDSYEAKDILSVNLAKTPDLNLRHAERITSLHSLTVEFRIVEGINKVSKKVRKFFAPNIYEGQQLQKQLQALSVGDFSAIREVVKHPIKSTAHIQLGDLTPSGNWVSRWAVIGEKRCMIFRRAESNLPSWCVEIPTAKISKVDKNVISIQSGIETILLKFTSNSIRDLWMDTLEEVQEEYHVTDTEHKEKEKDESDDDEDLPPPDDPPPSGPMDQSHMGCGQKFEDEEESYVAAWGTNDFGQMATPDGKASAVPVLTPIIFKKKIRSIAAGHSHAGCVSANGQVYMWGDGREKQLGLGKTVKKSQRPSLLTSLIRKGNFTHLALGRVHSMAVTELGAVWVWGDNTFGQLGLPELTEGAPYPTQLGGIFELRQACYIAAGGDTSAMILVERNGNDLYTWGANHTGQTGTGSAQSAVFAPTMIASLSSASRPKGDPVVQVSVGSACCAAVTKKGRLYTWGENKKGQLAVGTTRPRTLPGEVEWLEENNMTVEQVSVGSKHMIALGKHQGNSVVLTWGASVLNGFQEDQVLPAGVTQFENAVAVNASGTHSITINSDAKLFSFGINRFGELGNGKPGVQALVRVRFNKTCNVAAAACGVGFTVALLRGFTVALLRGENPPQITSSHYAKKAAAEKASSSIHTGPPAGMPKMPNFPGMGAPGGGAMDANAAIAALLNQFSIAPSDKNAQSYHGMAMPGMPGVPTTTSAAPATAEDEDMPMEKPKNKYAAAAKKKAGTAPSVAVAIDDEDADALLPAPPKATDEEEYLPPPPVAKPNEAERKAAQAAAAAAEAASAAAARATEHKAKEEAQLKAKEEEAAEAMKAAEEEAKSSAPVEERASVTAQVISSEEAEQAQKAEAPKKKKKKPLPEGWKKVKDPRTGRHYYYNTATRETSWKRPGKT
eukprot:g19334.t1